MTSKEKNDEKLLGKSLNIGFIGGIFWGAIGILLHYFNFTSLHPKSFVLQSWTNANWTDKWQGDVVTLLLLGVISVGIAALYYVFFRKINLMWVGVLYGAALWLIFYLLIYPLFPDMKPLADLKIDSIVTTICVFILYGLFIGYSISYDFYDIKVAGNQRETDKL